MKFSCKMPKVSFGSVGWILLLGFLLYRVAPRAQAALGTRGGDSAAPPFQLETLDGTPVSLAQYRGKVVLVNFWATWCPPCRLEMPGFQRVHDDNRHRGFVVLGISTDRGDVGVVREFLADRDITFPVAMASDKVVQDFGGVHALPTSFLIDRTGIIRHEVKGIFAEPSLRPAVNHLLDEPASPIPETGGER